MSGDDFLSRWSRRKHAVRRGESVAPAPPPAVPAAAAVTSPQAPSEPAPGVGEPPAAPLPALESLTPESDFAPFMKPEVDGSVRREALKTLFRDPHFNVMDGLDVYIDDYSKPDPIPEGWLARMNQVARLDDWKPQAQEAPQVPAEASAAGTPALDPASDEPDSTGPEDPGSGDGASLAVAQEGVEIQADPPQAGRAGDSPSTLP